MKNKISLDRVGKNNKGLVIRYIGRIQKEKVQKEKGIEVFIKAIQFLLKNNKSYNFKVKIAGKGNEAYIKKLQNNLPLNIEFLGFVKAGEFFKMIDVLVVPSIWYEPFPTVILEAYAHNIPVLGSNIGGIPELIKPGKTGFLFSPGNFIELANLLQLILQNRNIFYEFKNNIISFKENNLFSIKRFIKEHIEIYKKVSNV